MTSLGKKSFPSLSSTYSILSLTRAPEGCWRRYMECERTPPHTLIGDKVSLDIICRLQGVGEGGVSGKEKDAHYKWRTLKKLTLRSRAQSCLANRRCTQHRENGATPRHPVQDEKALRIRSCHDRKYSRNVEKRAASEARSLEQIRV